MIQQEPSVDGVSNSGINPFWPIFLLGLSFIALLVYQFTIIFGQRLAMQKQIQKQAEVVTRANQTQNELQRLVVELLALADAGDADAKAIVAKYKIANNPQPQQPAK